MKNLIYILTFLTLNAIDIFAQYPQYFSYDNENGLPSNHVYSIVQDNQGLIWIGCDAGIFKFDGVHYTAYKSETQNSKSITGLTISSSEKIYCYNFQAQLFCLEKDKLTEMNVDFAKINYLVCDKKGNLYVNHFKGISQYNEISKKWTHYENHVNNNLIQGTSSSTIVNENEIHFLTGQGIGVLNQGEIKITKSDTFKSIGSLLMRKANDELFIFSVQNELVYHVKNKIITQLKNTPINRALQNRKITNAVYLPDNHLWITTYKGVIKYNPVTESAVLFYPELSFNDCMIDREGNYWFTTFQNGLMRIPNLNFIVWNKENDLLNNDKINKLATDNTNVFFATINGTIGKLNIPTNKFQTFSTENNADVQSLDYDFTENRLFFNINKHLYYLKNNQIGEIPNEISTLKSFKKVKDNYFILSSYGTYVQGKDNYKISEIWSRELQFNENLNTVWIATNKGVLQCREEGAKWVIKQTLFPETQILSIAFDKTKKLLYSLTFDGQLFIGKSKRAQLPKDVQGHKLTYFDKKIYIATNKGVWIYDLLKKRWDNFNALSGLASENVNDIIILNKNLWLATGKGLQKIPLSEIKKTPLAKIYLNDTKRYFQIDHNEVIVLKPLASIYSANGKFEYAYRVNKQKWIKLPANIEQIEIQNLPFGAVEIELIAIDHLGRDSENIILLNGDVKPPFYKTWWFILYLVILFLIILLLVVKQIIQNFRNREQEKTHLANSQLTALKAQMNPHFIFNSMNSIQDLVLKGDVDNSYTFITKFSNLVRRTLSYSDKEFIDFDQEIKLLELYLSLEKLRFKDTLEYEISSDKFDDIMVPPMLIQPFIENALIHGLLHKKGIRKLKVQFELKEQLICIITDNGVGREKANEIKQRQRSDHESFSSNAIKKRFEILNRYFSESLGFVFEDLTENNEPIGTKVIIRIPLKYKY